MSRLRKYMRLDPVDRRLLFQAWVRLAVVRFVLHFLPFRWTKERLFRACPVAASPSGVSEYQIIRAVDVASRYLFRRGTCLTRAIVARRLLGCHGHASELRIGVARGDSGALEAHAWLVRDGRILVGRLPDLERYKELPSLGRHSI
ncbi:MAG: lasso peptide biosynthesis B2 protein [bacterium]|nr:lasso peptide biosynthesis B2 protein [bacterium]